jgi:hypothetical protein
MKLSVYIRVLVVNVLKYPTKPQATDLATGCPAKKSDTIGSPSQSNGQGGLARASGGQADRLEPQEGAEWLQQLWENGAARGDAPGPGE